MKTVLTLTLCIMISGAYGTICAQEKVYDAVEVEAEYSGGSSQLFKDIAKNFAYTEEAKQNCISGRILVSFVVTSTGKVEDIKIKSGLDPGLDQAAIYAISQLNDFIPAQVDGQNVSSIFNMPIRCQIDGNCRPKRKKAKNQRN